MYKITIPNIESLPIEGEDGRGSALASAARQFVEAMGDRRVFAFYGKMGAGKTTFIKAICEALGVEDVVTSPTFAIVNEYKVNEELRMKNEGGLARRPEGESQFATANETHKKDSSFFILHSSFKKVFHFDFYRIKNLREAYDIGCEEYFYSGCPCFIEWPELVEELLPEDTVRVNIEVQADGSRTVTIA